MSYKLELSDTQDLTVVTKALQKSRRKKVKKQSWIVTLWNILMHKPVSYKCHVPIEPPEKKEIESPVSVARRRTQQLTRPHTEEIDMSQVHALR